MPIDKNGVKYFGSLNHLDRIYLGLKSKYKDNPELIKSIDDYKRKLIHYNENHKWYLYVMEKVREKFNGDIPQDILDGLPSYPSRPSFYPSIMRRLDHFPILEGSPNAEYQYEMQRKRDEYFKNCKEKASEILRELGISDKPPYPKEYVS